MADVVAGSRGLLRGGAVAGRGRPPSPARRPAPPHPALPLWLWGVAMHWALSGDPRGLRSGLPPPALPLAWQGADTHSSFCLDMWSPGEPELLKRHVGNVSYEAKSKTKPTPENPWKTEEIKPCAKMDEPKCK